MKKSGQTILNGVKLFLRWVLLGFWNLLLNLFWLLIQLIELFVWGGSEIATRMKQAARQIDRAVANRDFELILSPLKWLLRGIWELSIQVFWLSIHLIELILWYASHLRAFTPAVPKIRKPVPRRKVAAVPREEVVPRAKTRKKRRGYSRSLYLAVVLITLFLCGFPLAAFLPTSHPFQGRIVVEGLSFRSGERPQSQVLLQGVDRVQQLSVEGRQRFTLTGQFASEDEPRLNRLTTMAIELPHDDSRWSIVPIEDGSQLAIAQLRLRQHTRVENLTYDYGSDRLSMELQPAIRTNFLQIDLGSGPLRVTLEGYRLTELQSRKDLGTARAVEFTFIPQEQLLGLNLGDRAEIAAIVPEPMTLNDGLANRIDVQDVQLYRRLDREEGNVEYDSTVVQGQIQMARRSIAIAENEFLMGENQEDLAIDRLESLEILPPSAENNQAAGIEVRISGTAKKIQVGSEPHFPEASIQTSILNQRLPQEAILALIPIWAAAVSYFIYWLIDNYSKVL